MSHLHKEDAKSSQKAKVSKMVGPGAADRFIHGDDKAENMAYYQNQKLDPLTKPNRNQDR